MRRVEFTGRAISDLHEIHDFIADDSPSAAAEFLERLIETCSTLGKSPEIGRLREEFGPSLRSFPVGRYVIFYQPRTDGIQVLRVISAYRDLFSLL